MEKRTKVLGKNLKVLLHLDLRTDRIIEFNQPGKNKKPAYKETRNLI
jgi:hypothetical protein